MRYQALIQMLFICLLKLYINWMFLFYFIAEKPQFITGLTDGQVAHGGEITLMVRADGLPRPDIKWYVNDKEITEAPGLIFATTSDRQLTSSLIITDYQEKDAGIVSFSEFRFLIGVTCNIQLFTVQSHCYQCCW